MPEWGRGQGGVGEKKIHLGYKKGGTMSFRCLDGIWWKCLSL